MKSILHKDLPGYVEFMGLKRIESPDYAGMPFDAVRDQTELSLLERNREIWVRLSDMLYSPAEGAAVLKAGENAVKIGPEGHAEWLVVGEDMILSLGKTKRGRIIVFAADGTPTYYSLFGKADARRGGDYVEISGFAGDTINLKTRPVPPR